MNERLNSCAALSAVAVVEEVQMKRVVILTATGGLSLYLTAFALASCGDDDGEASESKLSAVGESCKETADCEDGLSCVELKCVPESGKGDGKDWDGGTGKDGGSL